MPPALKVTLAVSQIGVVTLPATLNGVNWSFAPTVTRRGDHILSVEARDRAGNVTASGPHALNVTGYTSYLPVVKRNFP